MLVEKHDKRKENFTQTLPREATFYRKIQMYQDVD
jgi:hypothetical protein